MPNARRSTPNEPPPIHSTKQLGIRVPTQMSDRLEAIARREHNGVSAVCRRLLAQSLAAHGDEAA
jgi:hypothetical protein